MRCENHGCGNRAAWVHPPRQSRLETYFFLRLCGTFGGNQIRFGQSLCCGDQAWKNRPLTHRYGSVSADGSDGRTRPDTRGPEICCHLNHRLTVHRADCEPDANWRQSRNYSTDFRPQLDHGGPSTYVRSSRPMARRLPVGRYLGSLTHTCLHACIGFGSGRFLCLPRCS